MNKLIEENKFYYISYAIQMFIISLCGINTILCSISFFINKNIGIHQISLSIILSMTISWMYISKKSKKIIAFFILIITTIICISLAISIAFYDFSFDGQSYHQVAIMELSNGWNPFYDPPVTPTIPPFNININHFPKSSWLFSASLYLLTNRFELGKSINILLLFASFFSCLAWMSRYEIRNHKLMYSRLIIISIILSLNPVSLYQMTSFMIDGQISSLLLIIISNIYSISDDYNKYSLLNIFLSIIYIINLKFTAIIYSFLIILSFIIYILVNKISFNYKKVISILVLSYIIGIFFVGYNPYITNMKTKGNPLYPAYGPDNLNIMYGQRPANFDSMNRFEKLFYSNFSYSENAVPPKVARLKNPFSINDSEIKEFKTYDIRVGGFGPFFSEIIILSLSICVYITIKKYHNDKSIIITVVLVITIISNPEAWWARFVPQLWFIPIILSIPAFYKKDLILNISALFLTILVFINNYSITNYHLRYRYKEGQAYKKQLVELSKASKLVDVQFYFKSSVMRFKESDITFTEVNDVDCSNPITMVASSPTKVCIIK